MKALVGWLIVYPLVVLVALQFFVLTHGGTLRVWRRSSWRELRDAISEDRQPKPPFPGPEWSPPHE